LIFDTLQVVRDGRDISFSGNQSPVTKFYRNTYSDKEFNKWGQMPEVQQEESDNSHQMTQPCDSQMTQPDITQPI
jgi:hypothetical protein